MRLSSEKEAGSMTKRVFTVFVAFVLLMVATTAMAESEDIIYEYAFERGNPEYQMYYVFDIDDLIVRYFLTSEIGVMAGTFTGDKDSGFLIHWMEGWEETFQILDSTRGVLTDNDGFTTDWKAVPVEEAVAILNQEGYHDMELE